MDGSVAQSVEQRTENPCVGGSIPPGATSNPFGNVGVFCYKIKSPFKKGFLYCEETNLKSIILL